MGEKPSNANRAFRRSQARQYGLPMLRGIQDVLEFDQAGKAVASLRVGYGERKTYSRAGVEYIRYVPIMLRRVRK